ncbi:MAG: hypothetical protein COA78_30305 [Blastopirellula sp.]|nr:MAG: hypothetical protein COA78_30305 [Blastopirellula sp.]
MFWKTIKGLLPLLYAELSNYVNNNFNSSESVPIFGISTPLTDHFPTTSKSIDAKIAILFALRLF